jgi:hypothetical protein
MFDVGHATTPCGMCALSLPTFKFGKSRPNINTNRYPPAPSIAEAAVKSEAIPHKDEAA